MRCPPSPPVTPGALQSTGRDSPQRTTREQLACQRQLASSLVIALDDAEMTLMVLTAEQNPFCLRAIINAFPKQPRRLSHDEIGLGFIWNARYQFVNGSAVQTARSWTNRCFDPTDILSTRVAAGPNGHRWAGARTETDAYGNEHYAYHD